MVLHHYWCGVAWNANLFYIGHGIHIVRTKDLFVRLHCNVFPKNNCDAVCVDCFKCLVHMHYMNQKFDNYIEPHTGRLY